MLKSTYGPVLLSQYASCARSGSAVCFTVGCKMQLVILYRLVAMASSEQLQTNSLQSSPGAVKLLCAGGIG